MILRDARRASSLWLHRDEGTRPCTRATRDARRGARTSYATADASMDSRRNAWVTVCLSHVGRGARWGGREDGREKRRVTRREVEGGGEETAWDSTRARTVSIRGDTVWTWYTLVIIMIAVNSSPFSAVDNM